MKFLERERKTLEQLLPGLFEALSEHSLMALEGPKSPAVGLFRSFGGPGLLVPADYRGRGASPLEALQVQRALGAISPSLAVATTMHQFSMASLLGIGQTGSGLEWLLIEGIAADNRIMASGFAEGRPGGGILSPGMTGTAEPGGVRINGVKRPCSLAGSMDLLTASVLVPRRDGTGDELAVALIPAESEGLSIEPFWSSTFLGGAESHQVNLDNVLVPDELVVRTEPPEGEQLDALQTAGFVWFELLMTGSYLGVASALVERVLCEERVPEAERVRLLAEIEGAMVAAEGIARRAETEGGLDESALVDSLFVRYSAQDTIARVSTRAVELLGGMRFMIGDEVGYLSACCNGLALHPPARTKMTGPIAKWLAGGRLTIV